IGWSSTTNTLFCLAANSLIFFSWRIAFRRLAQHAAHDRAPLLPRADLEQGPYDTCSVPHNLHSHSAACLGGRLDTAAIVFDRQCEPLVACGKGQVDLFRARVACRVADRLLGDPVEVRRGLEPLQTARQPARKLDRNAIHRLAARTQLLERVARDHVLDRLEQQRDARELLAEAVVQIVADPLVLALAHLPDLGLEPPDLAHEALRDERHLARSRELTLQLVLSLDRLGDVLKSTPVGE